MFAILILTTIPVADVSAKWPRGSEVVLKLNSGPGNPRNSEGDFITLKDGRILYVYTHYTGNSSSDHASAFLAGRYSTDKGKSWSKTDVPIIQNEGKMNVMSVSLLRLQNGKIALFYLRKNSLTDCIPVLRLSSDEAETWSDPIPCIPDRQGYFVLNNSRVIQLKSGRIVLPVALHGIPGDSEFHRIGRIFCYYSDDNGLTWKCSREVSNPDSVVTQEPGLVVLKDGSIVMTVRTTLGVQYFSYSRDDAVSWSQFVPGNLKSPCSPATFARIPSTGDLMVVWNDNGTSQKRTPLNLAISNDEGKSWQKNKIIESDPAGSYCYTAIHFSGRAVLLGYFDWTTTGVTIRRVKISGIYHSD